jgi:hypothetical protein
MRGVLVAILVATPALLLPAFATQTPEIVVLLALLCGALTFAEYFSFFPSFIEFRGAPPLNRMRFCALFAIAASLSLILAHPHDPTLLTALLHSVGALLGEALDFPYSPVRLVILMMPVDVPLETLNSVRAGAGICYTLSLLTIAAFFVQIRVRNWPVAQGAFNVWVNLPLFDPTTGGDVVMRLQRDARINVILGVLLPFAIPALVKLAGGMMDAGLLTEPQALVWILAGWSFLPASMLMRGMAMLRVAALIEEKRRRAYANAEALQTA